MTEGVSFTSSSLVSTSINSSRRAANTSRTRLRMLPEQYAAAFAFGQGAQRGKILTSKQNGTSHDGSGSVSTRYASRKISRSVSFCVCPQALEAENARTRASMLSRRKSGWSPGRNIQPISSGCAAKSASNPRRTVSFRPGSAWRTTGICAFSQRAFTSGERVTTTRARQQRRVGGGKGAAEQRLSAEIRQQLVGAEPCAQPDAMSTQPTGKIRSSMENSFPGIGISCKICGKTASQIAL